MPTSLAILLQITIVLEKYTTLWIRKGGDRLMLFSESVREFGDLGEIDERIPVSLNIENGLISVFFIK